MGPSCVTAFRQEHFLSLYSLGSAGIINIWIITDSQLRHCLSCSPSSAFPGTRYQARHVNISSGVEKNIREGPSDLKPHLLS